MATTSPEAPISLRITRTLPATRERVFRAWTDAQALSEWFAPSEEYETTVPELDPKPGGRYRVEMRREGKVYRVGGIFREVLPPERLVFTWRWVTEPDHGDVGDTLVTIELVDRGDTTDLVLTHERFPTETAREEHDQGWKGCLDGLARFFASRRLSEPATK